MGMTYRHSVQAVIVCLMPSHVQVHWNLHDRAESSSLDSELACIAW